MVVALLVALGLVPLLVVLVRAGLALFALPLLVVLPAFVVFVRRPLLGVLGWLALNQFVVQGAGGAERQVYWLVHRAMPIGVVGLIVLVQLVGPRRRTLPRLGWPEAAMATYALVTLLSILASSDTVFASSMHFVDRIVCPMALYVIVRLVPPTRREWTALVAVMGFVVVVQTFVGLLSWIAPGMLPPAWLGREGTRTVGSLKHPNVYGVTMIFGALLLLHAAATLKARFGLRALATAGGLLALLMVFMTFGRANWVAALPAVAGLTWLHRRFALRFVPVAMIAAATLIASGLLSSQLEQASSRVDSPASQESALARLPVVYASLKMIEARPVTGFGFGNFDKYDRQFQGRVGNLVAPDKDHASHNLYLTIGAEQGLLALALYLLPAAVWFSRTVRRWRDLPREGFLSRKLLGVLWLALFAHLVVNNFANMRVVYGLGLWWLILGLAGSLLERLVARSQELRTRDGSGRRTDVLDRDDDLDLDDAPLRRHRVLPDSFRPLDVGVPVGADR